MRESFKFSAEDGNEYTVEFSVIKDEDDEMPYGISAKMIKFGEDVVSAPRRYFTYAEAIAVIDRLCRHQVMPCTLCDII